MFQLTLLRLLGMLPAAVMAATFFPCLIWLRLPLFHPTWEIVSFALSVLEKVSFAAVIFRSHQYSQKTQLYRIMLQRSQCTMCFTSFTSNINEMYVLFSWYLLCDYTLNLIFCHFLIVTVENIVVIYTYDTVCHMFAASLTGKKHFFKPKSHCSRMFVTSFGPSSD